MILSMLMLNPCKLSRTHAVLSQNVGLVINFSCSRSCIILHILRVQPLTAIWYKCHPLCTARVYVNVMSDTCINVTVHSTCILISLRWTHVTCLCLVSRKLIVFTIHIRYEATIILIQTSRCKYPEQKNLKAKAYSNKIVLVQEHNHHHIILHLRDDPDTIFTSSGQQLASHHSIEHLWFYQRTAEISRWTTSQSRSKIYISQCLVISWYWVSCF